MDHDFPHATLLSDKLSAQLAKGPLMTGLLWENNEAPDGGCISPQISVLQGDIQMV